MNENWCALLIAIQLPVTPERAFEILNNDKGKDSSNKWVTAEDVEDMKKLKKQGVSYPELAEMYGLNPTLICRYVKGRWRADAKIQA